jgi:hypothetical protein
MAQPGAMYTERELQSKVAAEAQPYFDKAVAAAQAAMNNMEHTDKGGAHVKEAASYDDYNKRAAEIRASNPKMGELEAFQQALKEGPRAPAPTAGTTAPAPTAGAGAASAAAPTDAKAGYGDVSPDGKWIMGLSGWQPRDVGGTGAMEATGKGIKALKRWLYTPGKPVKPEDYYPMAPGM